MFARATPLLGADIDLEVRRQIVPEGDELLPSAVGGVSEYLIFRTLIVDAAFVLMAIIMAAFLIQNETAWIAKACYLRWPV